MKHLYCGLLVLFLLNLLLPATTELVMVLDLFRHGARTPLDRGEGGGGGDDDGGEITAIGLRQSYLLGKYIRKRYLEDVKLLSPSYNYNEIAVVSTDTNRSLMTAQAHLVGIYENTMPSYDREKKLYKPPINVDAAILDALEMDPNVLPKDQQVIAVLTMEKESDRVLYPTKVCSEQFKHMEEDSYVYDDSIRKLEREMVGFAAQIAEKTKAKKQLHLKDLRKLTGTLMAKEAAGQKIVPDVVDAEQMRTLQFIYDYIGMNKYAGTDRIRRVIATPLMQAMASYFDGKIDPKITNPGKLIVMSGHDTTMIGLLASFKILRATCIWDNFYSNKGYSPECPSIPRFASSIFVELHKDNDNYSVKFFYNDQPYDICGDGRPGDVACPYVAFKAKINALQIDFVEACLLNGVPPFPDEPYYYLLGLSGILAIAYGIIHWRIRSYGTEK